MVDGELSEFVSVDSGVPQGTVLGPLLFLLHINDLPQNVSSTVRLFADDCLIYRPIKNQQDCIALQQDLCSLDNWASIWGMRFNVKKCDILRICRSQTPISRIYTLGEQPLDQVNEAKYLGITISDELDWSPHIDFITSKASNTLSFLRRNWRSCPQSLRELAYSSLVRSQLDYAAAKWNPYQVGHTQKIERIQRRVARFVCNNYSYYSSVTSTISTLGWTDLASRRKDLRLALFYKIVFGLLAVPTEDILLRADSRTRASHSYKYSTIRANTEPYRQSFFPRTIPEWNILPPSIAEAPSIDILRHALTPLAAAQSALSRRPAVSNSFPPPRFILQVEDSKYIARQEDSPHRLSFWRYRVNLG